MDARSRILFVDDEPQILRSLRRGLRRYDRWDLRFADGAEQALEELRSGGVDVLISDVTMPGTDGVELLTVAREVCPDAMRILMSGTTEGRLIMRAVPVAHRFLDKPVGIRDLARIIEDALTLRELLADPNIRTVVGKVSALPSLPRTFADLTRVLDDPNHNLDQVVRVVERDPGVSARVLHIVNSAFFGTARRIASVEDAVRHIGTGLLRDLVLVAGVLRLVEDGDLPANVSMRVEVAHAIEVASGARAIADEPHKQAAFTAGLLHDAGMLLFASELPDLWAPMVDRARAEGVPLHEVERQELGVTHAELGGYLFGIWGLPGDIVTAVVDHHTALERSHDGVDASLAVHLADRLSGLGREEPPPSEDMLAAFGVADRVAAWRREVDAAGEP